MVGSARIVFNGPVTVQAKLVTLSGQATPKMLPVANFCLIKTYPTRASVTSVFAKKKMGAIKSTMSVRLMMIPEAVGLLMRLTSHLYTG